RYMHDPLKWTLYDTCGVYHVSTVRGIDIFMLVEKEYPLSKGVLTLMLVNRLLNKVIEAKTYLEAASDQRWIEAMNLEMEALNRNNTWILTELPSGRKLIGCKWLFKVKYNSDGSIERFEARLVAKGFNQKEGIDYQETQR
ncbi:putative RNA-directed DNA polymerase, partial [Tanacetum coccineum]